MQMAPPITHAALTAMPGDAAARKLNAVIADGFLQPRFSDAR